MVKLYGQNIIKLYRLNIKVFYGILSFYLLIDNFIIFLFIFGGLDFKIFVVLFLIFTFLPIFMYLYYYCPPICLNGEKLMYGKYTCKWEDMRITIAHYGRGRNHIIVFSNKHDGKEAVKRQVRRSFDGRGLWVLLTKKNLEVVLRFYNDKIYYYNIYNYYDTVPVEYMRKDLKRIIVEHNKKFN